MNHSETFGMIRLEFTIFSLPKLICLLNLYFPSSGDWVVWNRTGDQLDEARLGADQFDGSKSAGVALNKHLEKSLANKCHKYS